MKRPDRIFVASLLTLLALSAGAPSAAFAWGELAHRTIGELARRRVAPATQAKITALLEPRGQTLPGSATWADQVRNQADYRATAPDHYVNMEDGESYLSSAINRSGDVVQALIRYEDQLRDSATGDSQRADALRFIIHYVGDLHQPLHAGRGSDKGGNTVQVQFFGRGSNLHRVMDGQALDRVLTEIGVERDETALADYLERSGELKAAASGTGKTFLDWTAESQDACRTVYATGGRQLDSAYLAKVRPILLQRIAQAGVRLAELLDAIFKPTPLDAPAKKMRADVRAALGRSG